MTPRFDHDPESTELATGTTIRRYRALFDAQDRAQIADMIGARFRERYLEPVSEGSPSVRNGFTMLAVCCLMVEALESFRRGLPNTDRISESTFCSFFHAHNEFAELCPLAHEFYRAVRCGILHQAETTNCWRVHRQKPEGNSQRQLLRQENGVKWINAAEFADRMTLVLQRYCEELKAQPWESEIWKTAQAKLGAICENCGATKPKKKEGSRAARH
jgi:hypothetical protein